MFSSAGERDTRAQRSAFLLISALNQVNGGRLANKAIVNLVLNRKARKYFTLNQLYMFKKAQKTAVITKIKNKIYSGMLFLD